MKPWMQAIIAGNAPPTSQTFTSNTPWPCPVGVTRLDIVRGEGADGSSDSSALRSVSSVSVVYAPLGTGDEPLSNDWSNAQARADFNESAVDAGGSVSYTELNLTIYADGTQTVSGATINLSSVIAGTASTNYSGDWSSSGAISGSGSASIDYQEFVPAASGASSTAFSLTFPGGAPNSAAVPQEFINVAVTPGNVYNIVVPAGGFVTITYYK